MDGKLARADKSVGKRKGKTFSMFFCVSIDRFQRTKKLLDQLEIKLNH